MKSINYLHLYCSARPSRLPHFLHRGRACGPFGGANTFTGGGTGVAVTVADVVATCVGAKPYLERKDECEFGTGSFNWGSPRGFGATSGGNVGVYLFFILLKLKISTLIP